MACVCVCLCCGSGFPLTQAALLVGGLWGLFAFRELRGVVPIVQFAISACVLVTASILLGLYG